MRPTPPTPTPEQALRTLQIIVGALLVGMLTFAAVVVFLVVSGQMQGRSQSDALPLVVALGCLALLEPVAFVLLKRSMIGMSRKRIAESPPEQREGLLIQAFSSLTIIGAALAEGLGLFGTVIVLITGQLAVLAAPVVAALALLWVMPTRDRLEKFRQELTLSR